MKLLRGTVSTFLAAGALVSVSAQPYGLESRQPVGPFLNDVMPETAPVLSGDLTPMVAFTNLYFTNAVGLAQVPGTNRLCVWEREGRVWTFENNPGTAQKTLVLDISSQCQGWDDSGLLGLAFHPGFETNGGMFVYYTWVAPGTVIGSPTSRPSHHVAGRYHDRLSRFSLTNGVAGLGSETVFVDLTGNDTWHNGGGMFFHPDNGFLYWTDGDDDNGGANAQRLTNSLFSGVFRIDVDQLGGNLSHAPPRQPNNGSTANYFIPNDNPFAGQTNVLEEYFCLGLRSPHRMTHDPVSGRIFIGDVGESAREEISVIEPGQSGLNFQWDRMEGFLGTFHPPHPGISAPPVLDYPHSDGHAVIGGYVYRGSKLPELYGRYIFGDNVTRTVWAMDESTLPAGKIPLFTLPKGGGPNSGADYTGLSSFGVDANNELYLCQMSSVGGQIYKMSHGGPPPASRPLPELLSETGAFDDLASLSPNGALIPYDVNSPLWSDGAVKSRWIALPTNTLIHFAPTGEWTFPEGTVFMKHFDLPVNDTNKSILRRLETRLLVRDTNGFVYGASYKWRTDDSDADLVVNGTNELIAITTSTGVRTQQWFYPGRQDCLTCHTFASGGVLGVKARQLNGDLLYPSTAVSDNQIRTWNHIGMFDPTLNEAGISGYPKLVAVTNSAATLEHRVRSYLDANCSQCHRPGGAVRALFDARFDTPLDQQGIVNGALRNTLGIPGAKVVAPANTNTSVLWVRDNSLGINQMPPLAKNVIDSNAMPVIADWILSLPHVQLTATPGIRFVTPGAAASFSIGVESTIGSTGEVALAASGLPSNTASSCSPATVVPPGTSTLSIVTSTNTPPGNYQFVITGTSGTVTNTTTASLMVSTNVEVAPGALVAHLTFDDGTASDLSSHANHGILLNGASVTDDPDRGKVLSLDGTDDYIDLGTNASLDLSDNGEATISAWVKVAATRNHNAIVTKGEWKDAYSLLIKGDTNPNNLLWTGNDTSVNSSEAIALGVWTHVAVVISNDLATFYINGEVSGAVNQDRGNAIDNHPLDHTEIGREDRSDDGTLARWYFDGLLDDVRIYEVALVPSDIQQIVANTTIAKPAFAANPLTKPAIVAGQPFSGSIAGDASDSNPGDVLVFSKTSGPLWLGVAGDGGLSGIPLSSDAGTNSFLVRVTDSSSLFDETILNINVTPAPPIIIGVSWQGNDLLLNWTGGIPPYQVQMKSNVLETAWQNIGGPIESSNVTFSPGNTSGFYRIQGR